MLLSAAWGVTEFNSLQAPDSTHINKTSRLNLTVQSQPSVLERSLYYPTWWGYHASFVTDFTLTGMILNRGGREGDPLYTLFGERNMAGVIGSAIAVHAFYSFISWKLYKESSKRNDAWRFILFATATGINSYFLTVHTYATVGNIKVYHRLAR